MKDTAYIHRLATLFVTAGLAALAPPAGADITTECRQEAELYGIPQEQLDDYLDGCVLSRGGYPAAGNDEEFVAPPDGDMPADSGYGEPGTPDLYDSGENGDAAQ